MSDFTFKHQAAMDEATANAGRALNMAKERWAAEILRDYLKDHPDYRPAMDNKALANLALKDGVEIRTVIDQGGTQQTTVLLVHGRRMCDLPNPPTLADVLGSGVGRVHIVGELAPRGYDPATDNPMGAGIVADTFVNKMAIVGEPATKESLAIGPKYDERDEGIDWKGCRVHRELGPQTHLRHPTNGEYIVTSRPSPAMEAEGWTPGYGEPRGIGQRGSLEQQGIDLKRLLRDCPLLHTTTCNAAERAWIERARAAIR